MAYYMIMSSYLHKLKGLTRYHNEVAEIRTAVPLGYKAVGIAHVDKLKLWLPLLHRLPHFGVQHRGFPLSHYH